MTRRCRTPSTPARSVVAPGWRWVSTRRFCCRPLPFRFLDDPELDREIFLGFDDSTSYRMGMRRQSRRGSVLRLGVSLEESPMPEAALGAFFPNGDRTSYHLGYGRGALDLALVWTELDDRRTTSSVDGLNGAYGGETFVLAVSFTR